MKKNPDVAKRTTLRIAVPPRYATRVEEALMRRSVSLPHDMIIQKGENASPNLANHNAPHCLDAMGASEKAMTRDASREA